MKKLAACLYWSTLFFVLQACDQSSNEKTPTQAIDQADGNAQAGDDLKPEDDLPAGRPNEGGSPTDTPPPVSDEENSWDQYESIDPEAESIAIFDGIDPVVALFNLTIPDPSMWQDDSCSFYILAEFTNDAGKLSYVVRTSFKHNDDWTPPLLVEVTDASSTSLSGRSRGQRDEIFLRLAAAGDIYSIQKLNMKWFHINHFDTFTCENTVMRDLN